MHEMGPPIAFAAAQPMSHCSHASSTRKCSRPSPGISMRGTKSLQAGTWFKLICGASAHDAPSIRNLCQVYTAAGVDCIDISASRAIIRAARQGIAEGVARGGTPGEPLLMVSVNDDSDPHFRKAVFDVNDCVTNCPMPCASVCPADAIDEGGVITDLCYGCGRCIPVCPVSVVRAVEYTHEATYIRDVLQDVDCVEIHTGVDHIARFESLWGGISDVARDLRVVAVSFPSLGDDDALGDALEAMWRVLSADGGLGGELIWQTDGRPMSGDIGRGTAVSAVKLARRVVRLLQERGVPGHVQLAGGTNDATVPLMRRDGLLRGAADVGHTASGVAVGGYARKIVKQALGEDYDAEQLSEEAFRRGLAVAAPLVEQIKGKTRYSLFPASAYS